jgi:hypothetical protein
VFSYNETNASHCPVDMLVTVSQVPVLTVLVTIEQEVFTGSYGIFLPSKKLVPVEGIDI